MHAFGRLAALASLLSLAVVTASAAIRLGAGDLGASIGAVRGVHRIAASSAALLVLLLAWRAHRLRVLRRASFAALVLMLGLAMAGWIAGREPPRAVALFNQLGGVALAALLGWLAGCAASGANVASAERALAFTALAFATLQVACGAALGLLGPSPAPAALVAHAVLGVAAATVAAGLALQRLRAGHVRCAAMLVACAACAPLAGIANVLPAPVIAVQAGHAAAAALLLAVVAYVHGGTSLSA